MIYFLHFLAYKFARSLVVGLPSCAVFSCPSLVCEFYFCPLFNIVFKPFFSVFPSTVPIRIALAKLEYLETWPNHLRFHFLTTVWNLDRNPQWLFQSFCQLSHRQYGPCTNSVAVCLKSLFSSTSAVKACTNPEVIK